MSRARVAAVLAIIVIAPMLAYFNTTASDILLGEEAQAVMPRGSGGWLFGPSPVWTNGSTATPGVFHPLSKAIDASGLIAVRFSIEMSEDSGNCKMRPAIRYSNDGVVYPDGFQEAPDGATFLAQDGVTWGTTYTDITAVTGAPPRAYVQFGVEVVNEGGTAINLCNATLRVEPRELVK